MVFLICTSSAYAEVNILDIRTGRHPDKTRIVLELSEVAFYEVSYLKTPKEIIIDLKDAPSGKAISALIKKAKIMGLVEAITLDDKNEFIRLHIKLRKPAAVVSSFTLKPDYGLQYRLVFDLKPVSAGEWGRLVKLTASPPPVSLTVPVPMPAMSHAITKPDATSPDSHEYLSPLLYSLPEDDNSEDYDDMVTGDSNLSLSGYMEVEGRAFTQSGFNPEPKDWTLSFALEPLLEYFSDTSSSQFMFRPFGRIDVNDNDRSHFDIRELKWTGTMDRWQMTIGIDTVFWGVTESNHLVDILNQDDGLEDIDQEDKLGQPMLSLSYDSDFGVISGYVMTYFRERRFPGMSGRLRTPLPVDYSQTQYEAGSDKWHTDFAVRWAHVIGNLDVGLYHFKGTSREPELLLGLDVNDNLVLIPRYNLINQTGFDLQGTFEDFLLKFEAIHRTGTGLSSDYWAMTGGFEYTFYGLGGGSSDIGILAEYLYDDRGEGANSPFEDDVFVAMRWAANDIDSTEILAGAIFDLNTSAKFINFEGSRRIGDKWKVTLDARFFLGIPMTDPTFPQSRDDFFQLRLARYF